MFSLNLNCSKKETSLIGPQKPTVWTRVQEKVGRLSKIYICCPCLEFKCFHILSSQNIVQENCSNSATKTVLRRHILHLGTLCHFFAYMNLKNYGERSLRFASFTKYVSSALALLFYKVLHPTSQQTSKILLQFNICCCLSAGKHSGKN